MIERPQGHLIFFAQQRKFRVSEGWPSTAAGSTGVDFSFDLPGRILYEQ